MRSLRLVPIALLVLAVSAGPALADQSHHTDHLALSVTAAGGRPGSVKLVSLPTVWPAKLVATTRQWYVPFATSPLTGWRNVSTVIPDPKFVVTVRRP